MPLTFVLVYRKDAMFARIIEKYVIIFKQQPGIFAMYWPLE